MLFNVILRYLKNLKQTNTEKTSPLPKRTKNTKYKLKSIFQMWCLGLGVGSEGAAGEKNMHDAEFTCALFRFIQLTCEGHNLGMFHFFSQ